MYIFHCFVSNNRNPKEGNYRTSSCPILKIADKMILSLISVNSEVIVPGPGRPGRGNSLHMEYIAYLVTNT